MRICQCLIAYQFQLYKKHRMRRKGTVGQSAYLNTRILSVRGFAYSMYGNE